MARLGGARKSASSGNVTPEPIIRGRSYSPLRVLTVAVGLAAVGAIALLIVQATAVNGLRLRNAPAIAQIAPNSPEVIMRLATLEFQGSHGLSEESFRRVMAAAPLAPLAPEPPLFHGLRLLSLGRDREAARFLGEAARRDPRSRIVRLVLLDLYLRSGQPGPAAGEIRVLLRLVPGSGRVLVPELARLARDPRTGGALAGALQGDPLMDRVLEHLVQQHANPALVLSLAGRSGSLMRGDDTSLWRRRLLTALVIRGEFERARSIWRRFNRIPEGGAPALLYDPRFENLPGGPPFDWELNATTNGYSGFAPGPSLEVEYYGRENADLASQLLTLSPGTYRLAFQVRRDGEATGGQLAWRVACHGSNSPLLDLRLAEIAEAPRAQGASFTVPPANCNAQWIRLVGIAGEVPGDLSVSISRLSLQRINRPS